MNHRFIMKKIPALLLASLVLAITACSSQTSVHIYARYLSALQTEKITQALTSADFNVVVNDFNLPETITSSTMLYSPLVSDGGNIDVVNDLMHELGIEINETTALVSGNHWYKKDSIALFLLPNGASTNDKIMRRDLIQSYQSDNCDNNYVLTLSADGLYKIVGSRLDPEQASLISGQWFYRQPPYLELRPFKGEDWTRYFEIHRFKEQDKVSEIEMVELRPLQAHQVTGECIYAYGTRI